MFHNNNTILLSMRNSSSIFFKAFLFTNKNIQKYKTKSRVHEMACFNYVYVHITTKQTSLFLSAKSTFGWAFAQESFHFPDSWNMVNSRLWFTDLLLKWRWGVDTRLPIANNEHIFRLFNFENNTQL